MGSLVAFDCDIAGYGDFGRWRLGFDLGWGRCWFFLVLILEVEDLVEEVCDENSQSG